MEALVQTLRDNPFDWILTDAGVRSLPARYGQGEAQSLAPSLVAEPTPAVRAWARSLALEQEVGAIPVLKLEILLHHDTLETVHL